MVQATKEDHKAKPWEGNAMTDKKHIELEQSAGLEQAAEPEVPAVTMTIPEIEQNPEPEPVTESDQSAEPQQKKDGAYIEDLIRKKRELGYLH